MTLPHLLPRRPLGKTAISVSPIGLAGSYGADATTTERAFHELGVNYFFVTARDAKIIEGLKNLFRAGHRDEIVIATGARVPTGSGVVSGFEQMAGLLGTEMIDVFHLYWVQAHWYVTGKTWPAMQKLKEEGKTRALSISCHDRKMARALVDELSLDAMMIRYNAAHRGAEKEIFATLPEPRPGVIAYTATRWGRLLKPLGDKGPMTPAECYRFALSSPSVDVALCGAGSFEELAADAAGAIAGPLVDPRLSEVRTFGDAVRSTATGQIGFMGFLSFQKRGLTAYDSPPMARLHRSRLLRSVVDAVGNTPMVRLDRLTTKTAPSVELYLKLELANPGGSVKDRAALRMMMDAIRDGRLTDGKILIDSTSGNTGVAYSMLGAALGYRVQLVMPSNVSKARKDIARAYGTEIIFSDPMEGSDGAIRHVKRIVDADPETFFYPDQYSNPSNPLAHYLGTAQEILDTVGDRITHFVTGLGTTGTMTGSARRLREHTRPIRCVAVEPDQPLHGLEGLKHLGSSIVPPIYDASMPHEIMGVNTEDGWDMADRVAREEGIHIGHSSGANVFAALRIAEKLHREQGGGCVVTIACDRGDRYFAPMKWEKKYLW